MDWLDYRKKLGMGFNDDEKAGYVITNLITYTKVVLSNISVTSFINYILDTGSPIRERVLAMDDSFINEARDEAIVNILLTHQDSLEEFLSYFIPLINRYDEEKQFEHKSFLETILKKAKIPYEILKDNDGYFVFPRGAKELDDALVSQPLEWLKDYPSARIAWIKALKDYSDATEETASDVADKFRKALETFFQEFFGGQKSLENYKSDYGKYLKEQGIPKEISGNFETLLQSYTQFMNNYAKHRDATSDKVLEYIMYQTGIIIRLLITLRQEEPAHAD